VFALKKKIISSMKTVVIGAGNVATHLSLAIQKTPAPIAQIYSRNEESASALANRLGTEWTTKIAEITPDADLYLFAVKDDALHEIISQMPVKKGLWVHTAGSIPMDIFRGYAGHYGVLYPLQTFSKNREINLQTVPFFIEAFSPDDEKLLMELAGKISNNVQTLASEKRQYLHVAAVFACNFTNHLYALACKLLEEQNIPQDVLLPLIDETAAKIHTLSPPKAQTGPAVRYDLNVINRHIELLVDPAMKEIYQLISQNIHKETSL
jgi:predicted short-subunit dehydrogenase-like oxidoreductase (DUF2520 family)